MNSVYFNLDEVIFFLKNGDFSFFDFYSDYSEKDAVVYMKGTGCLYICNVSDNVIPAVYMTLGLPQLHGHFAHPRRWLPMGTARQIMIYLVWHVNDVTTYQGGLSHGRL